MEPSQCCVRSSGKENCGRYLGSRQSRPCVNCRRGENEAQQLQAGEGRDGNVGRGYEQMEADPKTRWRGPGVRAIRQYKKSFGFGGDGRQV